MGSLLEELALREAEARDRVERLREQLAAEEEALSRLVITRETVEEILGEAGPSAQRPVVGAGRAGGTGDHGETGGDAVAGSPIGVVTVPRWRPGMNVSVLPEAYQDVLEVLVDTGGGMRAGKIAVALGMPASAAKVEGLRSKLKRLVERGWLSEDAPGLFAPAEQVQALFGR